jgi:hypothetical protein
LVDDERDKRLMSILGSDDRTEHLDEMAGWRTAFIAARK